MPYNANDARYESVEYKRVGRSGLKLPAISLGLWNNFGNDKPLENQRAILRRAFDLGVTHFDLANNYGPPAGSAESNFGRILAEDFRPYRDEMIISSKAGYDMWEGPYGDRGSRKYMLASLDQSLNRVTVTDARGTAAGWTASVSAADFTATGGLTIPLIGATYSAPAATTTGTVTVVPATSTTLGTATAINTATATGANTATWTPTIAASAPVGTQIGDYTTTVIHSVL